MYEFSISASEDRQYRPPPVPQFGSPGIGSCGGVNGLFGSNMEFESVGSGHVLGAGHVFGSFGSGVGALM